MNLFKPTPSGTRLRSLPLISPFGGVFLVLTLFILGVHAQQPAEPGFPESSMPVLEPESRLFETNQPPPLALPDFSQMAPPSAFSGTSQLAAQPSAAAAAFTNQPVLEVGPVQLRPHVLYRLTYGDGIQAQPGNAIKTAINQISPGIGLQLGQHWTLDYTPTLSYYSSHAFKDTFNNAVVLAGITRYEDWTFALSQAYVSTSEPLIETASQTEQDLYTTILSAAYQMSSAMSLELGANQVFRFSQGTTSGTQLTDTLSWLGQAWLNYQFAPRLMAGIGLGFGYDDVSPGSDMPYEHLQGRVAWKVENKLSFICSVGVEDRQFLNSGASDAINPIWGVSALYQIFKPTTLSLNGNQSVTPSYFQDELLVSSQVSAGLHQRLFEKFYLDVSGGYRRGDYSSTIAGVSANRKDHGTFANVRVGTILFTRLTAAVFYAYIENSSNVPGFPYSSTQVGLELGYHL